MPPRRWPTPMAEEILTALDERGYRSTAPRRAVAEAVAGRQRPFSAEELYRHLPHLGRATIYRTLKILVDLEVVCRVLLEGGEMHYQLSHRGHHHHLLCVECGSSQDLIGCDVEEMLAGASANHGFQLSGHRLEVYGRCRRCTEKTAAVT